MLISRNWLQDYLAEPLPDAEEIARDLTFHSFEIEEVEEHDGDTSIDVDVLPNRAHDCLCHRGIAAEIAAIRGVSMHDPLAAPRPVFPSTDAAAVTVSDPQDCPRYHAAVIRGVRVGSSPAWLQERLRAIGQKPINNIVDATNYVMFSLGQPLHAFDAGKLTARGGGWAIRVRRGYAGEQVTTLDGEAYTVSETDLCIADGHADAAIGIAGIKGGAAAEVSAETTDVILESANFAPARIRATSQRLGLATDASKRFENAVAPELTDYALDAAIALIVDVAGGSADGVATATTRESGPYTVGVSKEYANALLGTEMSEDDIADVLNRLGVMWQTLQPQTAAAAAAREQVGTSYAYGASVSYDAPEAFDCSSLSAYVYARAGVALPRISIDQYVYGEPVSRSELQPGDLVFSNSGTGTVHYRSREFLPGTDVPDGIDHVGVYVGDGQVVHAHKTAGEVVTSSLDDSDAFGNITGYRRVTDEHERFVVTVPFQRLDIRIPEDLVEEIGRLYGYAHVPETPLPAPAAPPQLDPQFVYAQRIRDICRAHGFSEIYTYTFGKKGDIGVIAPLASDKAYLRPSLWRNMCSALEHNARYRDLLGIPRVQAFEIGNAFPKTGEYTELALGVADGNPKARPFERIDAVRADIEEQLGISLAPHETKRTQEGDSCVVTFNLSAALASAPAPERYIGEPTPPVQYRPISPYPFVIRDIAVWLPAGSESDELLELIQSEAGDLLAGWRLFDTYERDGRVSYAFRLAFQSSEKTLTDEEANAVMERVYAAARARGWEVR